MKEYKFSDIIIGMKETFSKKITLEMESQFRKLSGDENPLHNDDSFAKDISNGKYNSHVSFGMLTASLCSTLAGMYLPGKYSLIHSIDNISFTNPVFVGDELFVTGEVIEKVDSLKLIIVKVQIKNQTNKTVFKSKMKIVVMK